MERKAGANPWVLTAVSIAGLDGRLRARATFAPLSIPSMGCMGGILPPSAHVAAGKVYFVDAKGVVRSLSPDGSVASVTTFPLISPQQMLSFAVSPDGGRVLGTVFTIPKNAFPCSGPATSGTFSFDAYSALSGQSSQRVYHLSWTSAHPQNVLELTGWDAVGPVGQDPTVWGTQGGGPGLDLGTFVHVDAVTVKAGSKFSEPGTCLTWSSVASGASVCLPGPAFVGEGDAQLTQQRVSIRRASGAELWHFTVTSLNGAWAPLLAPDAQHVVICCTSNDAGDLQDWLASRSGSQVILAAGFSPDGWLDARTLIGYSGAGLTWTQVGATQLKSIKVSGNFLGTITP
jgi:hypothetical protein